MAGTRAIPLVFPKARGSNAAKTNLFKIGTRRSRTGNLDGPIDIGDVSSSMKGGEEQFAPMNADQAPTMQEDFDEDGMPDAADDDADGTPNAMDTDNDGDGTPDASLRVQIGGQTYFLVQLHGHTQSEHAAGGRRYPMAWHFVHPPPDASTAAAPSR